MSLIVHCLRDFRCFHCLMLLVYYQTTLLTSSNTDYHFWSEAVIPLFILLEEVIYMTAAK